MFVRKYLNLIEYLNENLLPHRVNLPAVIWYNPKCILFYQHNILHNPIGPAIIHLNDNKEYYLYNVHIKPDELNAPLNYLKLKYNLNTNILP